MIGFREVRAIRVNGRPFYSKQVRQAAIKNGHPKFCSNARKVTIYATWKLWWRLLWSSMRKDHHHGTRPHLPKHGELNRFFLQNFANLWKLHSQTKLVTDVIRKTY